MSDTVVLLAGCAVACTAIKVVGPVLLRSGEMPPAFTRIVVHLAPALLAALVVTQTFADGRHLAVGANTVGVLAGGAVALRTRSEIAAVVAAAAVAALLRAA